MAEDMMMTGLAWAEVIAKVRPDIQKQAEQSRGREQASEVWTALGQLEAIATSDFTVTATLLSGIAAKAKNYGFANTKALDEAVAAILERI